MRCSGVTPSPGKRSPLRREPSRPSTCELRSEGAPDLGSDPGTRPRRLLVAPVAPCRRRLGRRVDLPLPSWWCFCGDARHRLLPPRCELRHRPHHLGLEGVDHPRLRGPRQRAVGRALVPEHAGASLGLHGHASATPPHGGQTSRAAGPPSCWRPRCGLCRQLSSLLGPLRLVHKPPDLRHAAVAPADDTASSCGSWNGYALGALRWPSSSGCCAS